MAARVLDLAPTSHPNRSQNPHWMQAARPRYGWERIAIGAGKACQPSFLAARSVRTPVDLIGSGGTGYGRLRGGSNGLAPASPDTPTSHSTRL